MNNSASGAAAAAAMLNPAVKTQIRALAERDGVTAEGISELLGVPVLIVRDILERSSSGTSDPSQKTDQEAQLTERAAQIEDRLADAEQTALSVMEDICANAQSDGVRLAAAEKILEIRTGKLRPQRKSEGSVNITIETMNTLIQQAQKAYAEQRAAVAEPTTSVSETRQIVERN